PESGESTLSVLRRVERVEPRAVEVQSGPTRRVPQALSELSDGVEFVPRMLERNVDLKRGVVERNRLGFLVPCPLRQISGHLHHDVDDPLRGVVGGESDDLDRRVPARLSAEVRETVARELRVGDDLNAL